MNVLTSIASILVGGGLLSLIQFFVNRHDKKHDRLKEITESIEKLSKKVDSLNRKGDERNAVSSRVRILRFADEMMEGRKHSKDSWDQCLSDITDYENYCAEHPEFKNNQTEATVKFINNGYAERLEKHDFL